MLMVPMVLQYRHGGDVSGAFGRHSSSICSGVVLRTIAATAASSSFVLGFMRSKAWRMSRTFLVDMNDVQSWMFEL